MNKKQRRLMIRLVPALVLAALLAAFIVALSRHHFAVLDAQGTIARQQRNLIIFATVLSLVIILPVFWLTFHIVRTYRVRPDGSQRAKKSAYAPDMEGNRKLELLWWAIPSLIILVLSVVTWQTSHSLDPYKPLANTTKEPITIQVVAMQWKWLFIYPDQHIATVNHFTIPVDTPVNFVITSDAPMNSFWIPQLGGQVYAMSGMTSQLHLQADAPGAYRGSSANISGEGFADMHFTAQAVSDGDFRAWVSGSQSTGPVLTSDNYAKLSVPAVKPVADNYSDVQAGIFDTIVMKDMQHGSGSETAGQTAPAPNTDMTMDTMEGMHHAQ